MKKILPLLTILVSVAALSGCERGPQISPTHTAAAQTVTELSHTDVAIGLGAEATKNRQVTVHYTGWLYDAHADQFHGKQFDSSRGDADNKPHPFSFYLGAGQVILGWDQGVAGMKVGGRRTLIIPADLAYGADGAGRGLIPANAPLIFDIELLAVK